MDKENLARIGRVIYGPYWQIALATEMNVNVRTVRGWASGRSPVPADVPEIYNRLLVDKIGQASACLHEVPASA